ncbi:MAG: DUF262 domain-containing HNH endonuclease family protein [Coriobacteriales bacterium]|jgi:uncharacterized protein with ParB-like and HNH nuclease domain|nr:DUF262 domain-containing HNH endonuclease family protein [Coriobacteriales bacterium]
MKTETKNIYEVLGSGSEVFYIPPFQRSYAWGNDEINRYFSDLSQIIDSQRDADVQDKLEHFFGVLVLKKETEGLNTTAVIVDGQQRLTTTLLLLIALRDLAVVSNENEKAEQITNRFLINRESQFEDRLKLKQVTEDWTAFRGLALGKPRGDLPAGKILSGYRSFKRLISSKDYSVDEYIKALTKINVACIDLDERPHKGEDPHIIFETLNSLGKPLTLADLLRNYVLLGLSSSEQTEIYEKQWHPQIEKKLGEKSSEFIRDFLQYKTSSSQLVASNNANAKALYAELIRLIVENYQTKKDFINDILRYAPWYSWILDLESGKEIFDCISPEANKNKIIVELLRNIFLDIGSNSFKPFVLGLLECHQSGFGEYRMGDDSLIAALGVVRTYLIRRRVVGLAAGENTRIPLLCARLREKISETRDAAGAVLDLLSNLIYKVRLPNDAELVSAFVFQDFYNRLKKYSKFILGKMAEEKTGQAVNFRDRTCCVERVMPPELSQQWKDEIGENWEHVHKKYLDNIGNLVLANVGDNALMYDTYGFRFKRDTVLQHSHFGYQDELEGVEKWDESVIAERTVEIWKRFCQTFSLPEACRFTENWRKPDAGDDDAIARTEGMKITPFDDNLQEKTTNQKPRAVLFTGEYDMDGAEFRGGYTCFRVGSWKNVLMVFFRWLDINKKDLLTTLVNNMEFAKGKKPIIATAEFIEQRNNSIGQEPNYDTSRCYSLREGEQYNDVHARKYPKMLFVFTHGDGYRLMRHIGTAMEMAGMPEDCVGVLLA